MNNTNEQTLLLKAIKRKIDAGEEILTLKHIYDLSEQEMRQVLDLYENGEQK